MGPGTARDGLRLPAAVPATGPRRQRHSAWLPAPPAGTLPRARPRLASSPTPPSPLPSPPGAPRRSPRQVAPGRERAAGAAPSPQLSAILAGPSRRPHPTHRAGREGPGGGLPGGTVRWHGAGRHRCPGPRRCAAASRRYGRSLAPHSPAEPLALRSLPPSLRRGSCAPRPLAPAPAPPPAGRTQRTAAGAGQRQPGRLRRPLVPGDARVAGQPAAAAAPRLG